jgi:2-polyprenyl-3-methyl-5-hydroxy-6-metoxy-1,4-benzoquinol methylase
VSHIHSENTVVEHDFASCPVCSALAPFAYPHPEARIFRCENCTHAFSDISSVRHPETYTATYYEEVHRNWFDNPNFELFDWIERHIPVTAHSIVDIGCGRGQFLDYLRTKRPGVRLVGVDMSPNESRNGVVFHQGDALDFNLGQFDAVVNMATIEHVSDATAFIRMARGLCNPDGVVITMTIDDNGLLYRVARLGRMVGVSLAFDRLYTAHHLQHFNRKSLAELHALNGLRIATTYHHGTPMASLDFPVPQVARPIFIALVWLIFKVGNALRLSYLQTTVATRADKASEFPIESICQIRTHAELTIAAIV